MAIANYMPRVTALATAVLEPLKLKHVTLADMLAVVTVETMGAGWWCPCDALFKANMQQLTGYTGISGYEFLAVLPSRVDSGVRVVPKFKFEPSYMQWANSQNLGQGTTAANRAVLACSWGLGQKMVRWLFFEQPGRVMFDKSIAFMQDENWQLRVLANDLDDLIWRADGNRLLAFTRYNAGPSAKLVSDYGRRVDGWYQKLK